VLLDEFAGAAHRDLVHEIEQVLGGEVGRIDVLSGPDVLLDRWNADTREPGVVTDEVLD
jgi:hypothetical protein